MFSRRWRCSSSVWVSLWPVGSGLFSELATCPPGPPLTTIHGNMDQESATEWGGGAGLALRVWGCQQIPQAGPQGWYSQRLMGKLPPEHGQQEPCPLPALSPSLRPPQVMEIFPEDSGFFWGETGFSSHDENDQGSQAPAHCSPLSGG